MAPRDGRQERTLEGHQGLVDAVAITPDGRRVVSGSWDKTLKVWHLETGALICTFNCDGRVDLRSGGAARAHVRRG